MPRGARLVQTPDFHVFCIAPSGAVYEITSATGMSLAPCASEVHVNGESGKQSTNACATNGGAQSGQQAPTVPGARNPQMRRPLPRSWRPRDRKTSCRATDMLQALHANRRRLAHLMARLLVVGDAQGGVTADVHVALAARAANLASAEGSLDLEMRYFAHGRLAESYGLLTFDSGDAGGGEQGRQKKRLLRDDALGAGLADSAAVERATVGTRAPGKRLSVEEFILLIRSRRHLILNREIRSRYFRVWTLLTTRKRSWRRHIFPDCSTTLRVLGTRDRAGRRKRRAMCCLHCVIFTHCRLRKLRPFL